MAFGDPSISVVDHIIRTPAENPAWAMIPLAIAGSISSLCTIIALSFILWKYRWSELSQSTLLISNLFFADIIQGLGWMFNYVWLARGDVHSGSICIIQGFLLNFADLSSSLWASSLAIHTLTLVAFSYKIKHMVFYSFVFNNLIAFWLSFTGIIFQDDRGLFYDIAGSWCWISQPYQVFRLYFHYGPMLFIAVSLVVIYVFLFINVWSRKRNIVETTRLYQRRTLDSNEPTILDEDALSPSRAGSCRIPQTNIDPRDEYDSDDEPIILPRSKRLNSLVQQNRKDSFQKSQFQNITRNNSQNKPSERFIPNIQKDNLKNISSKNNSRQNISTLDNGVTNVNATPAVFVYNESPEGSATLTDSKKARSWWWKRKNSRDYGINSDEKQDWFSSNQRIRIDHVAYKLFLYPIVYVVLVLPLGIYRITAYGGIDLPYAGLVIVGTIFACMGVANVIVYGVSRRLLPRWHASRTFRFRSFQNSSLSSPLQRVTTSTGIALSTSPTSTTMSPTTSLTSRQLNSIHALIALRNSQQKDSKIASLNGGVNLKRKSSISYADNQAIIAMQNYPRRNNSISYVDHQAIMEMQNFQPRINSRASSISFQKSQSKRNSMQIIPLQRSTSPTSSIPNRRASIWSWHEHDYGSKEEYLRERRRGRLQDSIARFDDDEDLELELELQDWDEIMNKRFATPEDMAYLSNNNQNLSIEEEKEKEKNEELKEEISKRREFKKKFENLSESPRGSFISQNENENI